MKQIIQSFKTGETILEEVPAPIVSKGQLLIKTTRSLVSLGTEKMLVEFGKASLIQKARQQPDKVKQVLDKIKSDGLLPTIETVFNKLEQPIPLGYCNVGKVIGVGEGVTGYKIGDRVASNGHHAEFVCVPQNLCAIIPDNISDEEATFTVIASIGLQSIRLLNPTLGETVVVIGMGLIGQLTAQLLKANGCNVIGVDIDDSKLDLANNNGITTINSFKSDLIKSIENLTNKVGADGVIITASNKSDEIIAQAAKMSRKRGKIILVGVIGLQLNRADFYEKELSFQVSCSYGPGRYDDNYEQKGIDYPIPYVRWTEKRNFETVLQSLSNKSINVDKLITENVKLEDYYSIYGSLGKNNSIASIITYEETNPHSTKLKVNHSPSHSKGKLAIIGAGNFTKMTLLPNLKNAEIKYIVSKGGLTAKSLATKHKIEFTSTNIDDVLNDEEVKTVIVTTRHNLHASMVIDSLKAGKNVFVEKPLVLNYNELDQIIDAKHKSKGEIIVGYNRRFSPHIQKIKAILPVTAPKNIIATMNAGSIPENVWVHDIYVGGGRIIGEACHYFDLLSYLSGSKIMSVCMNALGNNPNSNTDNATILLKFENGDNGVINYFSNGNKAYSKERMEIYYDEKTIVMDNFRKTEGFGVKGLTTFSTKQDKGHKNQFDHLIKYSKGEGDVLIPFENLINTTKACLDAIESMKNGKWVTV